MEARGLSAPELTAVTALWARTGRTVEARFTGGSMAPAIPDGATVRLECGQPPRVGDVAAFVWDGHVVLHRLVADAGPLSLLRGDALVVPDPPVAAGLPFARAVAIEREGAWVQPPAHAPSGLQSIVLWLCRLATGADVRLGRLLIAALRRLRPRPEASRLDVRG